jgi:hypothetical protein
MCSLAWYQSTISVRSSANSVATCSQIHFAPSPSTYDRPQFGRRAIQWVPLHYIQCSKARRFGAQAACEGRCWLAGRHITRLSQATLLPAASQANFDLVPVALGERAVQMPIPIADHHPIGFNHQYSGRWIMLACRQFVRLFNVGHRRPLLPSSWVPIRSACVRNVSLPTSTPARSLNSLAASRNVVTAPSVACQRVSPVLIC